MTGYDVINRATALLGISSDNSFIGNETSVSTALELINQILADLKCNDINHLSDIIDINEKQTESLCYGMAMLLSLIGGDSAKNTLFTELYNSKRSTSLCKTDKIQNTMPSCEMG